MLDRRVEYGTLPPAEARQLVNQRAELLRGRAGLTVAWCSRA